MRETNLKLSREREKKKKLVALWGRERSTSQSREKEERAWKISEIPPYLKVCEIHGFWFIKLCLDLELNPNPFILTHPNKEFEFQIPQIKIHCQIHNIQTDYYHIELRYMLVDFLYCLIREKTQPSDLGA